MDEETEGMEGKNAHREMDEGLQTGSEITRSRRGGSTWAAFEGMRVRPRIGRLAMKLS